MNFDDYLEYLFVTGEIDREEVDDLIKKYIDTFGELESEFFNLDISEQKDLLIKSLKYHSPIIRK